MRFLWQCSIIDSDSFQSMTEYFVTILQSRDPLSAIKKTHTHKLLNIANSILLRRSIMEDNGKFIVNKQYTLLTWLHYEFIVKEGDVLKV
jgi:hypothetical protein